MCKKLLELCERLAVCRGGVSAVEFALVAPILLLLFAGTVDFARVYLLQTEMADLARETARRIATGRLDLASATGFANDQLATRTSADIAVMVTETAVAGDGQVDVTVSLSVPLGEVMMFAFWMDDDRGPGEDEQMRLSASATMLKE